MKVKTGSESQNQTHKSRSSLVALIVALLFVLAGIALLTAIARPVSLSGKGERLDLQPNRIGMGTLILDEDTSAVFHDGSHWIGAVISKAGQLTVEDDVTISGPVFLFGEGVRLGNNSTVNGTVFTFGAGVSLGHEAVIQGDVISFGGGVGLGPKAVIRGNVVSFGGAMSLGPEAVIRGNLTSFGGPVGLGEKASLRGDNLLFGGIVQLGDKASAHGKLISFGGMLQLAPQAVLYEDAVLFGTNMHLFRGAQARGDVILARGNATLESQSNILGRLYMSSPSESGSGHLVVSPEAQITRGVIKAESIQSIAGWRIAGWVLADLLSLVLLPLAVLCLLLALMFYLGRRSAMRPERAGSAPGSQQGSDLTHGVHG